MKLRNIFLLFGSALFITACGGGNGSDEAASADDTETREISGESFTLTTEIPSEVIEGTPMPIQVSNVETPLTRAPTMRVPEGTELISLGMPVTSSDDFPIIGDLSYVTDGYKQGGEGYYVELMDGPQWIQIDLQEPASIEAIWVWHYHSQARVYHDVIVQVSNDPDFQTGVTTLFNNDSDNSTGLGRGRDQPYIETRFGKLIDGRGTHARFVRLHSNGNTANDMNHYTEVEVWGRR